MEAAIKILKFVVWVVSGVFILPCMFVASVLYPKWEKWGDEF
jgi:hypothetical protein